MRSAQYAPAEWEIGKALKELVAGTQFYKEGMQQVLSKHWFTALDCGNKFISVEQCVDGKLGDIMKDYT